MKPLIELLIKHNLTLAACESLTSGLFSTTLTHFPGTGKIFKGGLVVYSNEAKTKLAQVSPTTLEKYGAISKECAEEMARNTQQLLKADLAISFTGNAGPETQENKPVGLVWICLIFRENLISKSFQFSGSRETIREKTVKEGVELIKSVLVEK